MKTLLTAFLILLSPNFLCAKEVKKVFINQFFSHPALDKTTQGIIDGLENNGYQRGFNLELRVESAQANTALAALQSIIKAANSSKNTCLCQ